MNWHEKVRLLTRGKRWHRALSKALDVEESTLRRWVNGQNVPRDEAALLARLSVELSRLTMRAVTPEWLMDAKDNELPPIASGAAVTRRAPGAAGDPMLALVSPQMRPLALALSDPLFVSLALALLEVYERARQATQPA